MRLVGVPRGSTRHWRGTLGAINIVLGRGDAAPMPAAVSFVSTGKTSPGGLWLEIPCSCAHLYRLRLEVCHCHGGRLRLCSCHPRWYWALKLRVVCDESARRFGWWVLRPPRVSKWHCGCCESGRETNDRGLQSELAGGGSSHQGIWHLLRCSVRAASLGIRDCALGRPSDRCQSLRLSLGSCSRSR